MNEIAQRQGFYARIKKQNPMFEKRIYSGTINHNTFSYDGQENL